MIYFIAAGKGSRMKSARPKALHEVNGIPNIIRNIGLIENISDYRVVINKTDKKIFREFVSDDKLITIESGYGSGHAIMKLDICDDDIIIWGDAVIKDVDIVKELAEYDLGQNTLIIPLKKVRDPYVNFLLTENSIIKEVLFSKYGELSKSGYQDCCIFKVSSKLKTYLKNVHAAIWKDRYITESNEFEFLYIIHYLFNIDDSAYGYLTEYPDAILSYNNKEELAAIESSILESQ